MTMKSFSKFNIEKQLLNSYSKFKIRFKTMYKPSNVSYRQYVICKHIYSIMQIFIFDYNNILIFDPTEIFFDLRHKLYIITIKQIYRIIIINRLKMDIIDLI